MSFKSSKEAVLTEQLQRKTIIIILGLLAGYGALTNDMYLAGLPLMVMDLNSSVSLIQFSLTACLLGLAFGQLIIGPISDVHGRKVPLIIALVVYLIASLLCAFATSIWVLILLRFIQGAAAAAGMVISRACVRDVYSGVDMARYLSLIVIIMGIIPITAPILGGQLVEYVSWNGVFIVLALISCLTLFLVSVRLPETLPFERRTSGGFFKTLTVFRGLFRDRLFIGYALTLGFVTAAMFAYISSSSFVLQGLFSVSPQMFGILFAFNAMGFMIASQIVRRLVGKMNETKLLIVGLVISIVAGFSLFGVIILGASLPFVIAAMFFIVASVGIVNPMSYSLAMENQAENAGSAVGLMGVVSLIFAACVTPLVGIGGNETAIPLGVVVVFCNIGAALSYIILVRKQPAQQVNKKAEMHG